MNKPIPMVWGFVLVGLVVVMWGLGFWVLTKPKPSSTMPIALQDAFRKGPASSLNHE